MTTHGSEIPEAIVQYFQSDNINMLINRQDNQVQDEIHSNINFEILTTNIKSI